MAYESLEPFGEERADLRCAQICSVLANVNRSKDTKPFTPTDFLFAFDRKWLEKRDEKAGVAETVAGIRNALSVSKSGIIRVYEGEAPAIRRLGKRGRSAKSGKRRF